MPKKIIVILIILLALSLTSIYETQAVRYSNNLIHYVAKLKNKIPNRYTAPTNSQISILKEAARYIFLNAYAKAEAQANAVDYTVKSFSHINGSTYWILEPLRPNRRPWGTYIFYLGSDKENVVIEVPHPKSEKNTSNIGIKLFINSKAKAFFLSGSSRIGCDVAYTPETVFLGIHEQVTDSDTEVVQIHGFSIHNYPQIVLTSGSSVILAAMDKYVGQLIEDFNIGIYNGIEYVKLGSTNNVQAQYTNSIGGNFIGIFLNRSVHNSRRLSNSFIGLTETAISETTTTETVT